MGQLNPYNWTMVLVHFTDTTWPTMQVLLRRLWELHSKYYDALDAYVAGTMDLLTATDMERLEFLASTGLPLNNEYGCYVPSLVIPICRDMAYIRAKNMGKIDLTNTQQQADFVAYLDLFKLLDAVQL